MEQVFFLKDVDLVKETLFSLASVNAICRVGNRKGS
jgi:hypothetical protein